MKYRVKAAAKPFAGSSVEIAIYDVVGDLGEAGGVTSQDVLTALGEASQGQEVSVRINSAGGSVTEGLAIYNALRERSDAGSKVKVRIDGLAASIASIIAMAGDEIEIADNAFVMIHNPFALIEGESDELRNMANHLDDVSESMLGIYADRTGLSTEKLSALCDAETWLAASEALELGFVDRVVKRSRAKALALNTYDFSRFRAVPEVLARFNASAGAANKEQDTMAAKDEDDKDKKIASLEKKLEAAEKECAELREKMKAKAEKKDDSDDEDEDGDKDSDAKARVIAAAVAVTGIEDLPRLEGALMAMTHKRHSDHETKVLAAIKDGKLAPARKDWALKASAETFAAYLEGIGNQQVTPVGREYTPDPTQAKATAERGAALSADVLKVAALSGVDPAELAKSLPSN